MNNALQKLRKKLKENEWRAISGSQYCLGCGFARSWNGYSHAKDCWVREEIDKLDGLQVMRVKRMLEEANVILDRIARMLDK